MVVHRFDIWLTLLMMRELGTNMLTEFAIEHRMHDLSLRALPQQANLSGLGSQVSTSIALGRHQAFMATDGRLSAIPAGPPMNGGLFRGAQEAVRVKHIPDYEITPRHQAGPETAAHVGIPIVIDLVVGERITAWLVNAQSQNANL